ncbi:hypothetical protein SARC_06548 [Sphaeroforma arctica JP610]|uniref:Uncharacterized protein n=1 Tax=Sphaeroforma arctica JP610 TaxID=667725 RepID=A0A0L0FYU9_9EUKA|nr:hypothetical protein SARC_06548 [Sphaeroforma arctica JP610]KNC81123.1 hypothetical protein SARC_06548 [Sphaeroforma arctica JP610]|eukprot:XP_014155025.1 hypothetical protein SARC_06548 [Sphaeroforma arctica JP610]
MSCFVSVPGLRNSTEVLSASDAESVLEDNVYKARVSEVDDDEPPAQVSSKDGSMHVSSECPWKLPSAKRAPYPSEVKLSVVEQVSGKILPRIEDLDIALAEIEHLQLTQIFDTNSVKSNVETS